MLGWDILGGLDHTKGGARLVLAAFNRVTCDRTSSFFLVKFAYLHAIKFQANVSTFMV